MLERAFLVETSIVKLGISLKTISRTHLYEKFLKLKLGSLGFDAKHLPHKQWMINILKTRIVFMLFVILPMKGFAS
jgi:hypothetical protein